MTQKRALVIAPHADDEAFGMGGTILKLVREGWAVKTVVVCCGDSFVFEHSGSRVTRAERKAELAAVSAAFGVSWNMLRFDQDSLMDTVPIRDVISAIEFVQDGFRADRWYVTGPSTHQDHRVVYEATMAAARIGRKNTPAEVLLYELPMYCMNHAPWRFNPNLYENVAQFIDEKIRISSLYASQVRPTGPLSPQRLREWAVACGSEFGIDAAERFEVVRVLR